MGMLQARILEWFLTCLPPGDLPNPGLSHCRQILYHLSHQGSPRMLEWVAYPFSRESSRPRNQTRVSWIAGGFFTNWIMFRSDQSLSRVRLCNLVDYIVHGILQARILEWVSLSILQGIFQTQGSNPDVPHCRRILYQLSHKGTPSLAKGLPILLVSKNQLLVSVCFIEIPRLGSL